MAIIHLPEERTDAIFTIKYIKSKFGRNCISIATDISKEGNYKKAIDKISQSFQRVDVLVNNAAVQFPTDDFGKLTSANIMHTFSVNILAIFWITQAVAPYMKKNGAIINTTSVTAYRGSGGLVDYSSTKGAIVAFTRSLSSNLVEKGIRVNGVAPGPIWTPLIPATFPPEHVREFGTDTPSRLPAEQGVSCNGKSS